MGVPEGALSPGAKFEGPDPAYWCHHGYAVINPDSRGVGNSEGDIAFWGTGDGEDGYDLIEWVAAQEWCNGRVGMAGNSWLAIAQWYIAAETTTAPHGDRPLGGTEPTGIATASSPAASPNRASPA